MHNMRKYPIIFFAAAAALAACTKTEVIPVENDTLAEITYETAPVTRAIQKFDDSNIFASVAYYLPEGNTWDWGKTTKSATSQEPLATLFIGSDDDSDGSADGVIIAKVGDVWRNAKQSGTSWVKDKSYYWPKKGKLTFFAWSLNSGSLDIKNSTDMSSTKVSVNCTPYSGFILQNFDIRDNKNVDFMVAEVAADKSANEKEYVKYSGVDSGVPTLFKHKFTNVQFTVRLKEDYENVKITLNSIVFPKLADIFSYNQGPVEYYSNYPSVTSSQTYTKADQVVDKTKPTPISNVDQFIFLPQTFTADQVVEITYTIVYTGDSGDLPAETVTVKKPLTELFATTTGSTTTYEWGIGKKYTLDLEFALDEILWDPAVEDWTEDTTTKKDVDIR